MIGLKAWNSAPGIKIRSQDFNFWTYMRALFVSLLLVGALICPGVDICSYFDGI